jgi:hypothetical protein
MDTLKNLDSRQSSYPTEEELNELIAQDFADAKRKHAEAHLTHAALKVLGNSPGSRKLMIDTEPSGAIMDRITPASIEAHHTDVA